MSELQQRLSEASDCIVSRWSPERAEAVWGGVHAQRRRVVVQRRVGAAVAVLAVALCVLWWPRFFPSAHRTASVEPPTPSPNETTIEEFEVTPLTSDTRFTELERSPRRTQLRLEQGAARFRVAPRRTGTFEVLAGDVRATVLGTVFTVELRPDAVVLKVEEGRVRLSWPRGTVIVGRGEQHLVPRRTSATQETRREPDAEKDATSQGSAHPRRARLSWRALAEQRKYAAAYDALVAVGPSGVRDEPGDLLLAADVTRLGGHPAESVVWLRKVVDGHSGDARAPLAVFTLGRVYLDQLGQPHQAAEAFALARRMAPGGALAEDSLAREVEARARTGEAARARLLAQQYLDRYPNGQRTAAVRRHGGLDSAR